MRRLKLILMVMALVSVNMLAWTSAPWLQDDKRRREDRGQRREQREEQREERRGERGARRGAGRDTSIVSHSSLLIDDDEEIPDSLLHPRWKIQRTQPITQ